MDKKFNFANILSINTDDEKENANNETEFDLINSLIKDIDLRRNYSERYNFYINFIKMYKKEPKILKYVYEKLNTIKNINEKEKKLLGKLSYAMNGGNKLSISILNKKIYQILNQKEKNIKISNAIFIILQKFITYNKINNIDDTQIYLIIEQLIDKGKDNPSIIKEILNNSLINPYMKGGSILSRGGEVDNKQPDEIINETDEIINEISHIISTKVHNKKELKSLALYLQKNIDILIPNTTDVKSKGYKEFKQKLEEKLRKILKEIDSGTNDPDELKSNYKKILRILGKHYELKNLINLNSNDNGDNDDNDDKGVKYNNDILQLNYHIDEYNNSDTDDKSKLFDIKKKLISFENNPNNPYIHIALSFEDRFVFIFTTFFIRFVALILIQWSIDINIIRSFEEGFVYYAILYISIFWFVVLFVNIDNTYKIDYMNISNIMNSVRSLFYYFYMGTNGITRLLVHSCIICILIIVPVILNIKNTNNSSEDGEDIDDKLISYEDRKKLAKSLSLFTIFLWILTSIIATKF